MWEGLPMSMEERRRVRRWLIAAVVCGVLIGGILAYVVPRPPRAITSPIPVRVTAGASPTTTTAARGTPTPVPEVAATPTLPTPRALPASNAFTTLDDYRQRRAAVMHSPEPMTPAPAGRTPETELGRVGLLVRDYRAAYGANPVGNNREIVRTLLGDNPRGTKFLDPATARLNERGELLDAWGHPYFFHALSGTAMEIRSAGPDGTAYTADDLVK